eukprot:9483512-Pyramimonas_sp.AAC.1
MVHAPKKCIANRSACFGAWRPLRRGQQRALETTRGLSARGPEGCVRANTMPPIGDALKALACPIEAPLTHQISAST